MLEPAENARTVRSWLRSCERNNKISRNTIAVGLVVLDRLTRSSPLKKEDLFSKGGELKGSRSGLPSLLESYGIPSKFLKEATTRQAHQDAQTLAEKLSYGRQLSRTAESRHQELSEAVSLLVGEAKKWLAKQPIRVNCDRHSSPSSWISSILDKARGRSGGVVEQHLVGAKLQKRHPGRTVLNQPSHAGDRQTGRSGDFPLESVSYHVTATDAKEAVQRCADNVQSGTYPVLLVPKEFLERARVRAELAGIADRVTILSIEDFITQNVIEISTEQKADFFSVLREIIDEYNRRLEEVETDMSLKIELV